MGITLLFLRLVVLVTAVFAGLSLFVPVLGAGQPMNITLAGFTEGCEGKSQPCWHGIVPGVTTDREIKNILESRGYQLKMAISVTDPNRFLFALKTDPRCKFTADLDPTDNTAYFLTISPCNSIPIGDFIRKYGFPEGICVIHDDWEFIYANHSMTLLLSGEGAFSPYSVIEAVYLYRIPGKSNRLWNGFIPFSRYTGC